MQLSSQQHLPSQSSGVWTLVFRQTVVSGGNEWLWPFEKWSHNTEDPTSSQFSILDSLETFRAMDGKFTFLLRWPDLDPPHQRWRQSSNPVTANPCSGVRGYEAIDAPYSTRLWQGLERTCASTITNYCSSTNYSCSLLDGSISVAWWYTIGCYTDHFFNRIPGPGDEFVTMTELYALLEHSPPPPLAPLPTPPPPAPPPPATPLRAAVHPNHVGNTLHTALSEACGELGHIVEIVLTNGTYLLSPSILLTLGNCSVSELRIVAEYGAVVHLAPGLDPLVLSFHRPLSRLKLWGLFLHLPLVIADNVHVEVQNCTFDSCEAEDGVGIYLRHGTLFATDTVFSKCVARRGGAVFIENGSAAFLGCLFIKNQAAVGGAIAIGHAGIVQLAGSTLLIANTAPAGSTVHKLDGGRITYSLPAPIGRWIPSFGQLTSELLPEIAIGSISEDVPFACAPGVWVNGTEQGVVAQSEPRCSGICRSGFCTPTRVEPVI